MPVDTTPVRVWLCVPEHVGCGSFTVRRRALVRSLDLLDWRVCGGKTATEIVRMGVAVLALDGKGTGEDWMAPEWAFQLACFLHARCPVHVDRYGLWSWARSAEEHQRAFLGLIELARSVYVDDPRAHRGLQPSETDWVWDACERWLKANEDLLSYPVGAGPVTPHGWFEPDDEPRESWDFRFRRLP